MDLASRNAQLQQRIAELEALAEAAEAAAQVQQQQQADSPEPTTPQDQRMRALGLNDEGTSMQERATSVLKRAAAASRLSGMYEVSLNMHWVCVCLIVLCCKTHSSQILSRDQMSAAQLAASLWCSNHS